jgi:hypothetical protein
MLLIIPGAIEYLIFAIGIVSLFALIFLLNRLIFQPAAIALADRESPPPQEGYTLDVVLDDSIRARIISIGQIDSTIRTRMAGIREDHLILNFRKEPGMEEYLITVVPGGDVFFLPPHGKKFDHLKNRESFESRELIGNMAKFRLAAIIREERAIQYLEFHLTSKYFNDRLGNERMKFPLTLAKIFPSVNINRRNKKGIYSFGPMRHDPDEDAEITGDSKNR